MGEKGEFTPYVSDVVGIMAKRGWDASEIAKVMNMTKRDVKNVALRAASEDGGKAKRRKKEGKG